MNEPNLFSICAIAFIAVMLMLGLEALVIGLISRLFPDRRTDQELISQAIQQAAESRFPGSRVVAVEEIKMTSTESHASR